MALENENPKLKNENPTKSGEEIFKEALEQLEQLKNNDPHLKKKLESEAGQTEKAPESTDDKQDKD